MARKPEQITGQESLFYGDGNSVAPTPDSTLGAYYQAIEDGVPVVDILNRAEHITKALTEMGRISQIDSGFLTAVDTPSGAGIWERYRRGTQIVEGKAKDKLPSREQAVKDLLEPVVGYAALRATSPQHMPILEINARARHDWKDFKAMFTGPPNNHRRQEYKTKMKKTIRVQTKLRKKMGILPEAEAA